MAGFFYRLGKKAGPKVRKARWMWQTVFGSETEMITAEKGVGKDLADEVLHQVPACDQADVSTLMSTVSGRLAKHLRDKRRQFVVTAIEDSQPNAFALPGGYVFITRSILDLCHLDESQVAFIVAHEMAHIIRGHAMERIVLNSAVSFASNLATVRGSIAGWAKKVGVGALQSEYSRDQELDADALAVRLCRAAGYDSQGAEQLLTALARKCKDSDPQGLGKYFSSHPSMAVRISAIRRILK